MAFRRDIPVSGGQQKVKTVAELEADMHQNSPKKAESPAPHLNNANQAGDMTAFNKLLTMVKAASETNQNDVSQELCVCHVCLNFRSFLPFFLYTLYQKLRNACLNAYKKRTK